MNYWRGSIRVNRDRQFNREVQRESNRDGMCQVGKTFWQVRNGRDPTRRGVINPKRRRPDIYGPSGFVCTELSGRTNWNGLREVCRKKLFFDRNTKMDRASFVLKTRLKFTRYALSLWILINSHYWLHKPNFPTRFEILYHNFVPKTKRYIDINHLNLMQSLLYSIAVTR